MGSCQWTGWSEGAVALRCAASCGAGSSVVSGVVSLQRAPVVRHDRRAGQWARDALVKLQPAWSLDADKRGVEPPGVMAGAGATPTERGFCDYSIWQWRVAAGESKRALSGSSTNDAHSHGAAAGQFLVGPSASPREGCCV